MTLVKQKDSGAFLERRFAGLTTVEIQCSEGSFDLTNSTWGYQVLSSFFHLSFHNNRPFCSKVYEDMCWVGFVCYMLKVGLLGEKLQIYEPSSNVQWSPLGNTSNQNLIWYKVVIANKIM